MLPTTKATTVYCNLYQPSLIIGRALLLIERATATVFHRFMQTGRTSPALFSCSREGTAEQDEYVIKLKGGIDLGTAGLVCESVASVLAAYFGLSHPRPALVDLDMDLAQLAAEQEPAKAALLMKSIGTNFGTLALSKTSHLACRSQTVRESVRLRYRDIRI